MVVRQGFTLIEILIVLVIIGIAAAFSFPNFNIPTERARSLNAQNNLLAIYSAERNYYNNTNPSSYYTSVTGINDIPGINSHLNLNIQDDGAYTYNCSGTACTATRNNTATTPIITMILDQPVQLTARVNPSCTAGSNICP